MNYKIIGIFIVTLLILTTLIPVTAKYSFQDEKVYNQDYDADETSTFYSRVSDGSIIAVNWSYLPCWTALEGTVYSDELGIGQTYLFGNYGIMKSFLFFDTSSIPDLSIIKTATLSIYGGNDASVVDFEIIVQKGDAYHPHEPLQPNDNNKDYYSGNGGSMHTMFFTDTGYNDIPLNQDGKSWINKEGITKLCLRSNREIQGTPCGTTGEFEAVFIYPSEEGASFTPKLTVTYTKSKPKTSYFIQFIQQLLEDNPHLFPLLQKILEL